MDPNDGVCNDFIVNLSIYETIKDF